MSALPRLPADGLSLVVFGPGFGESIVVRAPPDDWLVVDSMRDRPTRRNPAAELLAEHDATASAIALTHPHEDHADGFATLIERWPSAKVGLLPEHILHDEDRLSDPDLERALRGGKAEHAMAAALDAWEREPRRRWPLQPQSSLQLGEATVTVLGPSTRAIERARSGSTVHPNALSGPMSVEWKQTRLILGADLPANEWQQLAQGKAAPGPGEHNALKVPHHGSRSAQPQLLAEPADGRGRSWILTPWKLGSGTLPRFDDDEGMALILSRVAQAHLTSLPVALSRSQTQTATRTEILEGMQRERFGDDTMVLAYDAAPVSAEGAWVLLSYDASGELAAPSFGDASLTITA